MGHSRELLLFTLALAFLAPGAARADTLEAGEPADLFTVAPVVTGLSQPTSFAFLPDGRMVITEKGGDCVLAATDGQTQTIGSFPVDTASEKGLLNVLVHPDFASNRRLIFYYSADSSAGGTNTDRHRVVTIPMDASDQLDFSAETILVRGLRGPANHDGGALAIGPDGKLYIGVGDTGCNSGRAPEPPYTPTNFFGTCLTNGNGKILRVNLDGSTPNDNPLVGQTVTACGDSCGEDVTALPPAAAREDVWAWGFRNPWRIWFDGQTGNLWVGDVGEVTFEEIDVIPPSGGGTHFGWPWREGGEGHPVAKCEEIQPSGACVDPAYYCRHGGSQAGIDGNCESVTGGVIVDSCQFPASFRGKYFFGDNGANWIATLDVTADRGGITSGSRNMFARSTGSPVHIGTGPDGGLYYVVISGSIQRVFPQTPATCPPPSGTGGATGGGGRAGGGGPSGGGATGDASVEGGTSGGNAKDDSSCGCRLAETNGTPQSRVAAGLVLALAALRRRRSRVAERPD